jgi:hypothetical protein
MREKGLHIEGYRGEIFVQPVQVTDDFDEIGTVDFVLSCSFDWDRQWVLQSSCSRSGPAYRAILPVLWRDP